MSILFAATYPERVWALVLVGSYARVLWAPDYPSGAPRGGLPDATSTRVGREWGTRGALGQGRGEPRAERDEEGKRALATLLRHSSSPAPPLPSCADEHGDRRPARAVPRSACRRSSSTAQGDSNVMVGGSRYLAEHIAGARHWSSFRARTTRSPPAIPSRLSDEIERFLTEVWEERAWETPSPSACSRPCSSPTSSAPPRGPPSSATRAGGS